MVKGGRYKPEDFEKVYRKLLMDLPLEPKHNDHPLVNRKPERDLHIKPDWLLIYKYDVDFVRFDVDFVRFIDTGTHADLFQ